MLFGFLQFREARRDRLEASEALERAVGVEQSVERLNSLVEQAESQLADLQTITDFSFTASRAANDNREAFDHLVALANREGSLKQIASDAVARIITDINPMVNVRVDPKPRWEVLGTTPESATFDEITSVYRTVHPNFRPHVLSMIWTQTRFPECVRLAFLAEVIREEHSLRAMHRACVLMNNVAKVNKNVLGASIYLEWCEKYELQCS